MAREPSGYASGAAISVWDRCADMTPPPVPRETTTAETPRPRPQEEALF
jgi:hypothetical protein